MAHALRTVGYELATIEDFVATLCHAKVRCVIDVRAVPVSRKPGFSKKRLRARLAEHGIDYLHVAALGNPKPGREAAKAGRYDEFLRIYETHLRSSYAEEGLKLVAETASRTSACLLCFERDPTVCHRALVADRVSFLSSLEVDHLMVERGAGAKTYRAIGRVPRSREGRSPAQPEAR